MVTEVFANLAAMAARSRGYAELRTLVLPHPMETKSVDEIEAIVLARFDDLVSLLVAR